MATVNFSVPDEIKQAFNNEFSQKNKSAILTRLMQQAIEESRAKKKRADAIDMILALRSKQAKVLSEDITHARERC